VGLLDATTSGGLTWPLTWPLDWGSSARTGGEMEATNDGNVAVWPALAITGPVVGPVVTQVDSGDQLVFDPTWSIAAGETVEVDTDFRTVHLAGITRNDRLQRRDWFPLLPGMATRIQFSSTGVFDPAAALTVTWRDGYI
jgi:hypothetical protein